VVDYRWELLVQKDGVVLNLERFFSTLGIASIIMPALIGIVADRWINAEKLYGILHKWSSYFYIPQVDSPTAFYGLYF
jgi:NHS family xanthosine MFS transporter